MEHHYINFPELIFTSPGVYSYTVRELTPSDERWETDNRVFRAVVTVTDSGDGALTASLDYPDGVPNFTNIYRRRPCDICKCFNKLPFPMFMFMPPQKPEYMELMKSDPDVFDRWVNIIDNIGWE